MWGESDAPVCGVAAESVGRRKKERRGEGGRREGGKKGRTDDTAHCRKLAAVVALVRCLHGYECERGENGRGDGQRG